MGAGKVLCILGGIITLISTYLFSFASLTPASFYGIGFILNIPSLFATGDWLFITLTVVFIIFLLAGLFILLGLKSRALAIIGSLFAIVVGAYFILTWYVFGVFSDIGQFSLLFVDLPLINGIIPLEVPIGGLSLGTYLLVGGGVLGLIGGIIGPDSF